MNLIYLIMFFVLGAILGSFFNVVGLRQPKNIPYVFGRSYCPMCKKNLKWYELIPIVSYGLQKGRCRNCQEHIPIIYPLIEFSTASLFTFSFYQFGFHIEFIIALCLISMLMILFVTDLTYMILPNKILLFFLPIFILLRLIHPLDPWWTSITGSLLSFLFIAMIIVVSKGGMGAGDMKLFAVIGIVIGLQMVVLTFLLACLIGSLIGGYQRIRNKIERGQAIPFGPSIVMATILTYFYGDILMDWYLQLF